MANGDDKSILGSIVDASKLASAGTNDIDKFARAALELSTILEPTIGQIVDLDKQLGALAPILKDISSGFGDLTFAAQAQEGVINKLLEQIPLLGKGMAAVTARQFEAATSFNQLTQTGGQFGQAVHDVTIELAGLGLSAEEISTGMSSLFNVFTDFAIGGVTRTEQDLAVLVGTMESVGVSSTNTVAAMQVLRKGFLQNDKQIGRTILELEAFAEASGQSSDALIADFSTMGGQMALFGDRGVDVFKELSAASRATGMEMAKMLDVAKGFDTFDDAASSVGGLNQLLGGPYLNTIELIQETDPTQRMMMLKDAFDAAGKSVQDMGYYQRQAFVSAIPGIDSALELTKVLEGDFDLLAGTVGTAGKSMEELQAEAYAQMSPADAQEAFLEAAGAAAGLVPEFQAITQDGLLPMVQATEDIGNNIKDALLASVDVINSPAAKALLTGGPLNRQTITDMIEKDPALMAGLGGGAAIGGAIGGPAGALIGAGVGAGGEQAVNFVLNVDGMALMQGFGSLITQAINGGSTGSP